MPLDFRQSTWLAPRGFFWIPAINESQVALEDFLQLQPLPVILFQTLGHVGQGFHEWAEQIMGGKVREWPSCQAAVASLDIVKDPCGGLMATCIFGLSNPTLAWQLGFTISTWANICHTSKLRCNHIEPVMEPSATLENQLQLPAFPEMPKWQK